MNFLHTYNPEPIALSIGFLDIQWYGIIMSIALVIGFFLIIKLAKGSSITSNHIINLILLFFIVGLIGGRIGHIVGEWDYYINNLSELIKIWHGGLAIHGFIIANLLGAVIYCRRKKINFWQVVDLFVIVLAVTQAIGRWGNYFNQELFGFPTNVAWAIFIDINHRPIEYIHNNYFHPVFLYESVLMFGLFLVIFWLYKRKKMKTGMITVIYFLSFGIIRFFLDFFKIDLLKIGPFLLTQWISILIIIIAILGLYKLVYNKNES